MAAVPSAREAVRCDIARLAHRGLGVHDFARTATRILNRAVPCEGTCVLTVEPATMLPTGEVVENALTILFEAMGPVTAGSQ